MCFEGVRLLGAVSPRVRVVEKTILHMADTQAEFSIDDKHEGEIRAKTENISSLSPPFLLLLLFPLLRFLIFFLIPRADAR